MSTGSRPSLHAVPTTADPVPAERAGSPTRDLLDALDDRDEEAVYAWFRAHGPTPGSLLVYGVLLGVGVVGLMEWPAVLVAALGQFVIDQRFDGVENLAAQLRSRVDARTA